MNILLSSKPLTKITCFILNFHASETSVFIEGKSSGRPVSTEEKMLSKLEQCCWTDYLKSPVEIMHVSVFV